MSIKLRVVIPSTISHDFTHSLALLPILSLPQLTLDVQIMQQLDLTGSQDPLLGLRPTCVCGKYYGKGKRRGDRD